MRYPVGKYSKMMSEVKRTKSDSECQLIMQKQFFDVISISNV